MKHTLLKKVFSSGLQAIAVQIIGALFFLILPLYLSKDDFGIITTLNSMAMMLATLLSFGLEQVVVRRIAASRSSDWAAAAYLFHAFAGSAIAFCVLLAISWFSPNSSITLFLPYFFAAQSIMYIGTPLRQYLNAKQQFIPYGIIAFISNICKILFTGILIHYNKLTLPSVYYILIICACIELAGLLWYVLRNTAFRFSFKKKAYHKLLREALPQYFVVIFDSSLSRIDVILMGLITTNALTGEYGLAYRAYEISRLPVVIIAPIILVKFSQMLAGQAKLKDEKAKEVSSLFSVEIFLATLIPLALNILWSPLLDHFSNGKYGTSNATEFLILSICIPFQFAINILWTLAFASRKYKAITVITVITAGSNLLLNLAFIPIFGGIGAASVYLASTIVQAALYYNLVRKYVMHLPVKPFLSFILMGSISYIACRYVPVHFIVQVFIGLLLYIVMAIASRQIRADHVQTLKSYMAR